MNVEALGGYTSSGHVPFWLRSNQYGSIPLDNTSLSLIGSAQKEYNAIKNRIIDWGASFEGRMNLGHKSTYTLIEGYGKIRIGIFEIKAGRTKDIMGLCDTTLSSGSFSVSGNALGVPKVQIDIPEFYSLPILGKLFAFKASYAHGWLGEMPTTLNGSLGKEKTYFHQKSLYGRLGKPDWKIKLYGGFNHQVFWGSEKFIFGNDYNLSVSQTYLYVITGKRYANGTIERSAIGNHLGSVDIGFEYELKKIRLLFYRQNFYDYIGLKYLANIRDGLNGLCLINKYPIDKVFQFRKVLVEFFYSKDQGKGHLTNDPTYNGEEYYNNYIYPNGWSYKGIGLGTPFISVRTYIREGLSSDNYSNFINNRVISLHIGLEGSIERWNFIIKTSYSKNYGTYSTSLTGQINQLSAYIEGNKELKRKLKFSCMAGFDAGELYYNSFGLIFRLSKSFH